MGGLSSGSAKTVTLSESCQLFERHCQKSQAIPESLPGRHLTKFMNILSFSGRHFSSAHRV